MFKASDDNQQLVVYRALSSIIQNKNVLNRLIPLNLIDAACHGLKSSSKKGVVTHALKLLQEIIKTKEGLLSAKDKNVAAIVRESIKKTENDSVVHHLGIQIIELLEK